jgi:hypothetical protein
MRDLLSYIRPRQQGRQLSAASGAFSNPSRGDRGRRDSVSAHPTHGARRANDDKPVNVDARRLAVLLPASLGLPDEIIFVIIKFCFSLGGRVRVNRVFTVTLVGLIVVSAVPPSALAFHCVARSTNGSSGWANRAFLGRASELPYGLVLPLEVISTEANVILLIVAEGRSIQVAI